jgi:hypothetical protein
MPIVRRAVAMCPHLAHVAAAMFETRADGELIQPVTLRLPETPQVQEWKARAFSRHTDMFLDAFADSARTHPHFFFKCDLSHNTRPPTLV